MEGENSRRKTIQFLGIELVLIAVFFVGIFIIYKVIKAKRNKNSILEGEDETNNIDRTNATTTNNNSNSEKENYATGIERIYTMNENANYIFSKYDDETSSFMYMMYSFLTNQIDGDFANIPIQLEYNFVVVNTNKKSYVLRYDTNVAKKLLTNDEELDPENAGEYLVLEEITGSVVEKIHFVNGLVWAFDLNKIQRIKKRLIRFINDKLSVDLNDSSLYGAGLKNFYDGLLFLDYNLASSFESLELKKDLQLFRRINTLLEYFYSIISIISTKKIRIDSENRIVLSDIDDPENYDYEYVRSNLMLKKERCNQYHTMEKLNAILENRE